MLHKYTATKIPAIIVKALICGLFLFIGAIAPGSKVLALETGLSVYPAQFSEQLQAGAQKKFVVNVANELSADFNVQAGFVLKENYNKSTDLQTQSINWFTFTNAPENNFVLSANQIKQLDINLIVPEETATKGYIPQLILRFTPIFNAGNTANITEIAIDFLLAIENQNQKLDYGNAIKIFQVENSNLFSPDVLVYAKIENNGNVFFRPKGLIHIYDPVSYTHLTLPTIYSV